jgi:hypothetical protein
MNEASKTIITWVLSREGRSDEEITGIINDLATQIADQNEEAILIMNNLIAGAKLIARGTDQQADIDRLCELHLKLARLDLEEKAADAISKVVEILETAPKSEMEAKIKSKLIEKTLAPFENVSA